MRNQVEIKLFCVDKFKYTWGFLIIQFTCHQFELAQIIWTVLTQGNVEVQRRGKMGNHLTHCNNKSQISTHSAVICFGFFWGGELLLVLINVYDGKDWFETRSHSHLYKHLKKKSHRNNSSNVTVVCINLDSMLSHSQMYFSQWILVKITLETVVVPDSQKSCVNLADFKGVPQSHSWGVRGRSGSSPSLIPDMFKQCLLFTHKMVNL